MCPIFYLSKNVESVSKYDCIYKLENLDGVEFLKTWMVASLNFFMAKSIVIK